MLLQGGFVVADGAAEGVAVLQGEVKIGERGFDDVLFDEGAGGGEAAVEIEGGDDGFEGVGEEGGLSAAAAVFFAAAEAEERAEVDAGGDFAEVAAADEGGAKPGEFALAGAGEAPEEGFGDSEAEDGVADELELFVIGGGVGEGFGIGLVGERAVGQGPVEEIGLLEAMIEERRRSWLFPRFCGLFVARRHRSPLRSTLPDRTGLALQAWLVWGVADDMRLFGFAARVSGASSSDSSRGLVFDLGSDEGVLDAFFGGGLGVGLGVADGEGGLVLGDGLVASGRGMMS